MERVEIGQLVKHMDSDTGDFWVGTVTKTTVVCNDYIPAYQRAYVDVCEYADIPRNSSYPTVTAFECGAHLLEYA